MSRWVRPRGETVEAAHDPILRPLLSPASGALADGEAAAMLREEEVSDEADPDYDPEDSGDEVTDRKEVEEGKRGLRFVVEEHQKRAKPGPEFPRKEGARSRGCTPTSKNVPAMLLLVEGTYGGGAKRFKLSRDGTQLTCPLEGCADAKPFGANCAGARAHAESVRHRDSWTAHQERARARQAGSADGDHNRRAGGGAQPHWPGGRA